MDPVDKREDEVRPQDELQAEEAAPRRTWWEVMMPVFACGSGLFSDGYINNVRNLHVISNRAKEKKKC